MITYTGTCIGGPRDGELIAHWDETLYVLRQENISWKDFDPTDTIEMVPTVGYYIFSRGYWIWKGWSDD